MTRTLSILCLCLTLVPHSGQGQHPGSLFRYIALSPHDTIALGTRFTSIHLADQIADNVYQLREGTFGGAERIRIITDPNGLVTVMEFQYADTTGFDEMLKDYRARLGVPTSNDSTRRRRLIAWQDSQTRFELTSVGVGDRQIISTRLVNVLSRR